jgi:RHS repeat-associated protein
MQRVWRACSAQFRNWRPLPRNRNKSRPRAEHVASPAKEGASNTNYRSGHQLSHAFSNTTKRRPRPVPASYHVFRRGNKLFSLPRPWPRACIAHRRFLPFVKRSAPADPGMPELPLASGSTVLVSQIAYNNRGEAYLTKDWETLFCGYRYEITTGLMSARERWLHSLLGCWLRPDPLGYNGGINLFEYCGSNPVERTDAFGLKFGWSDAADTILECLRIHCDRVRDSYCGIGGSRCSQNSNYQRISRGLRKVSRRIHSYR